MKSNYRHIFTHSDLDGAASLLVYHWFHPDDTITFDTVSNLNVEKKISEYFSTVINPQKLYLFDISVRESLLPFDLPNFTFIDHHKRSEEHVSKFKNAKIVYKDYTSTCKLIYKLYNALNPVELPKEKQLLIAYVDDFDSGNRQIQNAYDLNILFHLEYRNDVNNFIKDYINGWLPFTNTQKKNINSVKMDALREANSYTIYSGVLNIEGKEVECLSTFGKSPNNTSIDIILNEKKPNIFFYINTEKENVIIRQRKSNNMIDLAEFARKYCDGNGNQLTAGGKLTDLFFELTKNLRVL